MLRDANGPRARLQNLRSFCLAAEHGSISKAAEIEGLSQPTVSLQIQALEEELQTSLFQRRGPRIALTADGRALLDLARPLVEGFESLPSAFRAARQGVEAGRLTVAAGESTLLHILPPILRRFATDRPGVELKIHNVSGREGLKLLRDDAVDLVVGSLVDVPDDIEYRPIFNYEVVLITPEGHPLAGASDPDLAEIARYPLILPPRHLNTWKQVDRAFRSRGLAYRVAVEAGGWEVIQEFVAAGLGIAVVTGVCLGSGKRLGVVPLSRFFPARSYGPLIRRGRTQSPAASHFLRLMDGSPVDVG